MRQNLALFLLVTAIGCLHAQTPPCGIAIIRTDGPNTDERFVPFPPEHVKFALLRALPPLTGKVSKDDGLHIEAHVDRGLLQVAAAKNRDAGVRGYNNGMSGLGKFTLDIRPATQDGVSGAMLSISFHKTTVGGSSGYAKPLAEETACLAKLLSSNDPVTNPRGLEVKDAGSPRAVALPGTTPLKVILRDPLYSRALTESSTGQAVQFEVAEDVVVDGAILIRRGALATGHFTNVEKTKARMRNAEIAFVFDAATAVDGQKIPVTGAGEKAIGSRTGGTAAAVAAVGVFGFFAKGTDTLIRAGTTYDLEVSGQHTVHGGR